jgi:mannan endo-1,4-beta-mannosidase
VTVKNQKFYIGRNPYFYIGTNYWYGVNLGAPTSGDRQRMVSELDQLKSIGIDNLRIMAGGQGPDDREKRIVPSIEPSPLEYNEDVWIGFDFLLNEMRKRSMKAVVPINNYWEWSGGFGQYVEWHGGDFEDPLSFYTMSDVHQHFLRFIEDMLNRTNTISGIKYSEDSTVMAWQLSNEPRIEDCKLYQEWIRNVTQFIKERAPKHLVSLGNEGTITPCAKEGNQVELLDYTTFHCWAQNWGWYDPQNPGTILYALKKVEEYLDDNVKIGEDVKKPVVLEEFGIARDFGSYNPNSNTAIRDIYYTFIFEYVVNHVKQQKSNIVGTNFWAYGGHGRPREDGGWWKPGDEFIGDPPHERQGWYSVYDNDTTIGLVRNYTNQFQIISEELKERFKLQTE